jgi:hypothetical protein
MKTVEEKPVYAMYTQFQEIVHAISGKEADFFENKFQESDCNKTQKTMLRILSFWKLGKKVDCY